MPKKLLKKGRKVMSLHQVKVATKEVLEIVKENKKKHDAILKDAIEGYWLEAEKSLKKTEKEQISSWEKAHKEQLKKMRKQLRDNKKNLKEQIKKELGFVEKRKKDSPWQYMRNSYPESHADDYIGTIRRLELCVEEKVELDTQEFDRYVRNKWEWRDSFLNSNTGYITAYWNYAQPTYAISASWASGSCNASYAPSLFGTGSLMGGSSWANNSIGIGTSVPTTRLSTGNDVLDNF